jgi:predicted phage terminase large subunit-like protein
MVIWDAGAEMWKPDELIDHVFKIADQYQPVEIGVEEDGLNEFVLQPLRHEQLRRNMLVPIRAMKAPKGKIAFIESLQPFFLAGEVSFAKELPALVQQFLAFPTGHIDAPNALAYALRMRPGLVVYDDFSSSLQEFERLFGSASTPTEA